MARKSRGAKSDLPIENGELTGIARFPRLDFADDVDFEQTEEEKKKTVKAIKEMLKHKDEYGLSPMCSYLKFFALYLKHRSLKKLMKDIWENTNLCEIRD